MKGMYVVCKCFTDVKHLSYMCEIIKLINSLWVKSFMGFFEVTLNEPSPRLALDYRREKQQL